MLIIQDRLYHKSHITTPKSSVSGLNNTHTLSRIKTAAGISYRSTIQNNFEHRQTCNLRIQNKKKIGNLNMLLHEKSIELRWDVLACCIMILSKTLTLFKFTPKYIKCKEYTKKRYNLESEKKYSIEKVSNIKRFFWSPVKMRGFCPVGKLIYPFFKQSWF